SQVVDGAAAENVGEDGADAARVALGADEVHSNLHIDNADDDDAAEDDEYGQDEAEDADEADDSDADDADDADEADETDEADNVDDLDEVVSREPSHTETTSDLDDEDN